MEQRIPTDLAKGPERREVLLVPYYAFTQNQEAVGSRAEASPGPLSSSYLPLGLPISFSVLLFMKL